MAPWKENLDFRRSPHDVPGNSSADGSVSTRVSGTPLLPILVSLLVILRGLTVVYWRRFPMRQMGFSELDVDYRAA